MAEDKMHYDAIVVGSGISGGWAAKELTEKGLKVLMLERGQNVEHIKDYTNSNKDPWEFPILLRRGCLSSVRKFPGIFIRVGVIFNVLYVLPALQHQDLQSLFCEFFCGPASGNPGANNDRIIMHFVFCHD